MGVFRKYRLGKKFGLYSGVASTAGAIAGGTLVHLLRMYL